MKKMSVLIAVGIAASLYSCKTNNKDAKAFSGDSTFTLTGKITGTDSGEMVLFKMLDEKQVDTLYADKNGNFSTKGVVKEPKMALLFLPKSTAVPNVPLSFFVEPGSTAIEGKKAAFDKATVKGGASNDDLKEVETILHSFDDSAKALQADAQKAYMQKNEAAMPALQQRAEAIQKAQKDTIWYYINHHPKSYIAAFYLYQFSMGGPSVDQSRIADAYVKLDTTIKQSFYGKKLKDGLNVNQNTAIGAVAPAIELGTPDGKSLSLASLKGKYVLVDFWASWCGPCRQENPNVVKAYNQYKDKNFTILGVSLDNDKAAWQQAIASDKLTWNHVSDLKGWESTTAAAYGVQAIPANFLLDKDGKIIAKNLRGEELDKKLAELLK